MAAEERRAPSSLPGRAAHARWMATAPPPMKISVQIASPMSAAHGPPPERPGDETRRARGRDADHTGAGERLEGEASRDSRQREASGTRTRRPCTRTRSRGRRWSARRIEAGSAASRSIPKRRARSSRPDARCSHARPSRSRLARRSEARARQPAARALPPPPAAGHPTSRSARLLRSDEDALTQTSRSASRSAADTLGAGMRARSPAAACARRRAATRYGASAPTIGSAAKRGAEDQLTAMNIERVEVAHRCVRASLSCYSSNRSRTARLR